MFRRSLDADKRSRRKRVWRGRGRGGDFGIEDRHVDEREEEKRKR